MDLDRLAPGPIQARGLAQERLQAHNLAVQQRAGPPISSAALLVSSAMILSKNESKPA